MSYPFMQQPTLTFRTLRNYIIALALFSVSCNKGDKIPAYIEVRNPIVNAQSFPVDEGTSSSNITYAWIFIDDQTYGPWELPARVPILSEGDVNIKVVAGVERNGSSTDIIQYPFFTTYEINATLDLSSTLIVEPEFEYRDNLEFWNDSFDSGNLFSVAAASDTTFEPSGSMTFEGNNSGAIFFDSADVFFEAQTNADFVVPSNSATFLELNYAGDQIILIGSYVVFDNVQTRSPLVILNPTQQADGTIPWKKVYIDLGELWASNVWSDRELFVAVTKSSNTPTGAVYLDNVKIVHREL